MATDIIARGLAVNNSGGGGGSTSVDIQDGVGIEFTGSDPIIINNGGITNVQTGNDSDDNGTIRVTYGKDSKTKSVPVKGLDNAAYKNVDNVIDESTKDSENLPTTKAVKKVLDSKIDSGKLGEANGIATLDEYKKLVSDQLPSHNHGSNEVDAMTNYRKPSTLTEKEIKETDSLNTAIGKLEKNLDDKMDDGNYAGSSTKGGSATSAEKLSNTEQIGTNKKPVYFSADGVPIAIDHTINSDVPENAKFTDTKYSAGTGIRVTDDTMYNMGVLSVSESTTNGCVDFTVGKNGTETSESKTIPVHGIGDAAYKSVDTVITKDSANLITSGAVSAELDKKMDSSMRNSADGVAGLDGNSKINVSQIPTTDEYNVDSAYPVTGKAIEEAMNTLPNPMLYKGSLGTGGTITALPTASASNEGFTYKVITSGTYAGQSAKVGDVFISNGTEWTIIPSGDEPEGTVISVGMSVPTGLKIKEGTSPVTTSGTIEIQLDEGYVIPKEADIVPSTRKINNITLESDVVLDGDDIKTTGYAKAESKSNITGTDTINQALGKLELKSDTNETNILLVENGSYKTHNLTDNIVRLTENKDGYAYITSIAGDVIKSVGKNLINPTEYEGTTGSGHFTTTAASDGSCTIVSDGANWTHNGYVSGKVKIPITKPGTFYFVCEHISGNVYTQNTPTTPVVCGHRLVLFDASGTKVGTETYSDVSFLAETGTVLRTKTITAELIQAGAVTLQIAIWGNGTTSAGYRIYDNYKFRTAAYFDDNSITADTPYQPYKESVETCDASGHCYIMTYEDGSVYSQNDYLTKTITVDYPESDFAASFNKSDKQIYDNASNIDELMNAVDNWFDVSQCIGLDNTYVTSTIGTDGYITVNTKSGVSTNTECYETTQLIDISKFSSGRFSLWIDFASGSISGSWLGFRVRKYDANKDYVISSYVKQETKVNGFYKIDTLSVDELINEGTYYIAITIWRSSSNVYTDAKFKVYVTDDEIYPSHQEYCLSKISLREDINKKAGGIEESQNNYIEMKSGQRVYADTEEPYGNIEVGSIGVGFDSGLREFGVGAKKSATTFPVTFGTDGTPVTNYTIYGNSGGVGDRSTNYVDRMNLDAVGLYPNQTTGTVEAATGSNYSIIIPVSSLTDCFFSINRETTTWNRCRLAGYATYPEVGTTATFVDNITGTATDDTSGNYYYNSCADIPSGTNYIMVFLASAISSISSVDLFREAVKASKPMLTSGIEKLPYVKYYSIPITCNSVTSEISLDAPLATGESVAYEDSGSPIYTVNGQNTMAFGSTVAPAKIEFEYVGWHPTGEIADLIARVEALEAQL